MKRKVSETQFERPHIDEGLHHAEFIGEKDGPEGKYGPRVIAEFEVYPKIGEKPVIIGAFFNVNEDGSISKGGKYMEALKSIGQKEADEIDTDNLVGNPCRVMVEDYVDKEGNTVSGINKVKPPSDETVEFIQKAKEASKKDVPEKGGDEGDDEKPVSVDEIEDAA